MTSADDHTKLTGDAHDSGFVPDAHQRELIDEAVRQNRQSVSAGHFIPEDLRRRMQDEADVRARETECP
ncbi:hypothetical protein [Roseateles sp. L2-2]|uniref:hypothetical protein n=1 Tax=Roseateles sp. L2-2 TaxID=3422597 RepID=UPI003D36C1D3